jgi:hypothetical protein
MIDQSLWMNDQNGKLQSFIIRFFAFALASRGGPRNGAQRECERGALGWGR